jgi:hypothetical protein
MAQRPGVLKRQKEMARKEKQQAKSAKKEQRKRDKEEREKLGLPPAEDPDIAAYLAGLQTVPEA